MINSRLDWSLISAATLLSILGIVILYGGGITGEEQAYKKIIWLILGLLFMVLFRYINYQILGSYSTIIYAAAILILLLTLVPFIGTKTKGARSWIRFFDIGFQPTELAKLALVILLAKYLTFKEADIDRFKELLIPFGLTAVPMVLIAMQPDLGYAVIFLPTLFLMLFIGGANISVLFGLFFVGFTVLFIPTYLEYHKFILVEDIRQILQEKHFKLADAVHILSFDLWKYIELENLKNISAKTDSLYQWALKTIAIEENQKILKETVDKLYKQDPVFLRDFLKDKTNIVATIVISLMFFATITVFIFFRGRKWLQSVANFFLILSLALSSYIISTYFVSFKTHQVVRIVSFANPEKFQKGAGYQLRHSLITLGSGKIEGKGILEGDMTKGVIPFLPEWHNDFIFSVVGEQLGFWGTSLALTLLFLIVVRGIIIAIQSKDEFGSLLASGITIIFFLHVMINIGISIGLFPVTGIPLIFISSGGSNMVSSFIGLGILLNINDKRFINV